MTEEQQAAVPLERPAWARRSNFVLGGVVAAGVILALAAIGTVILRPAAPAVYPAGSPEAAFQAFLTEYDTGDLDAAYAHFSASVRSRLSFSDFRRMADDYAWQDDDDRRVVLDKVDATGDSAVLHIRVERFTPEGLGGNRTSYAQDIRLVREAGAWRIDEPLAGTEPAGYYAY